MATKPLGLGAGAQVIEDTTRSAIIPEAAKDLLPAFPPTTQLLMFDIEALSLDTRCVILQAALLGYDLEEDELLETRHVQHYPIDPQQEIIPARKISGSTLSWWMKQSDEARERFELSTATDFEDLVALVRNFISVFNQITKNGTTNYEICAKHPQYDLVAMATLIKELGLEVPWNHQRVTDLATDLRRAGINPKNIPTPKGFIEHVAYWDARWQIEMFLACKRVFSGRA